MTYEYHFLTPEKKQHYIFISLCKSKCLSEISCYQTDIYWLLVVLHDVCQSFITTDMNEMLAICHKS